MAAQSTGGGEVATARARLGLEADLARAVHGEVRFDDGTRALYSTDSSNYRQVPIGVVVPRSLDDVEATFAVCRDHGAPVLSRGGGTSLAGQCCNIAVVVDWSKYLHRVLEIDPDRQMARVEPGCVLDRLRSEAGSHGLTFGPDPSTHDHCTLGGMIGNNSCGVHSVVAGRTAENVEALEVLTYDGQRLRLGPTSDEELEAIVAGGGRRGEIYRRLRQVAGRYGDEIRKRYPDIPRRVSGYNLDELLPERGFHAGRAVVGSEGTCVAVLEAEVRLIEDPPVKSLLVLGYPDVTVAADDVPDVLEASPRGLEGLDRKLYTYSSQKHLHPQALSLLPEGQGWLLVEFGGETKGEANAHAHRLMARLGKRSHPPSMKLFDDPRAEHQVWLVREAGLAATARIPAGGDTWPGWEDSAVPPERAGDYLRDLGRLYDRYGYDAALYGHFGQGCIHSRIDFDLKSTPGIAKLRDFMEEAAELVVSYGGSLSGEHGDGQARAELLPKMFGDDVVAAFGEFKAIWDPDGRMNPGKVVDPRPLDADLRLGPDYAPAEPMTFFQYPHDSGSFARATLRCVGVGKCRREEGGVMCPSYQVTREEEHSTRGRARLLFEMLQGDVVTDAWRSEAVHDALDLCLACKGCKGECPMRVDMATYKAEFLAHHYAGRLRPAAHYSMGWLPVLARGASVAPGLVNRFVGVPAVARLAKRVGGIDPQRELPRFASRTFRSSFSSDRVHPCGRRVLVWPDTFTNYFHPHIGHAAVEVLAAAGFTPVLPDRTLCCGLTLISTGQLKTARRVLRRTLDVLRHELRRGTPVVGLEPSCTAVFRSDLTELFAHDEDAQRLAGQTFTLAELLQQHAPDWQPARLGGRAIVQEHCHHKAILGIDADRDVFARAGVDAEILDSGCCGLAGNFGFEEGHYGVSMACAERVLLPAVRSAGPGTLVVADGFSCRTQVEQALGRRPVHLAEVLQRACRSGERAGAAAGEDS